MVQEESQLVVGEVSRRAGVGIAVAWTEPLEVSLYLERALAFEVQSADMSVRVDG